MMSSSVITFLSSNISCRETMYSMFKDKLQIVPLTNLNKYLHNNYKWNINEYKYKCM